MKINWGTSMLIVYSLFAGVMIIFAIKASQVKYDLVTENYYDEAVKYQERIDENANAETSATRLSLNYSSVRHNMLVSTTGESKIISGMLAFYKPDKAADDFSVKFETGKDGTVQVSLPQLAHGYWKVSAIYSVEEKNCFIQKKIFVE